MGIRGLFSYVHSNAYFWINISQILEKDKLSDDIPVKTRLIIDGPNLANQLHTSANLDSLYGGQYQELYEVVRDFLNAVLNAGFLPIVVLEETMEQRKREKILSRREEKLRELNKCVHNGERVAKLPRLGYITFTQAVLDLKIETVACDSEADPVISALASRLDAYILSNDSDFFLTCVPGVLAIDLLSWSNGVLLGSCFQLQYFLQYHNLKMWVVPFVVMMLGNDFIPHNLMCVIEEVREKAIRHLSGHKISRVLQMLTQFQTETDLLMFIQSRLSQSHWLEFQRYYYTTVSSYLNPDSLIRINPSLPHYGLEYRHIREKSAVSLYSLLRVSWAWGAIINGETLAQCNVEHFQRDPSTDCSLPIRTYVYSFIMTASHITEVAHNRSLSLMFKRIELRHTLPNGNPLPNLDDILHIPVNGRWDIFLQISCCTDTNILQLQDPWRLVAFTLRYWYLHCQPHPPDSLLEMIITSCVITHKYPRREYHTKFSHNTNRLIPYFLLPYHQVAQWHTTHHDLYRLAMILCLPGPNPCLFYNGRLLFHIIMDIEFREKQLHKFIDKRSQLWIHYLTETIVNKIT